MRDISDEDNLLGTSLSVRKQLKNFLRQQVSPNNLTAVLGPVEVAEALSVYSSMEIHATK